MSSAAGRLRLQHFMGTIPVHLLELYLKFMDKGGWARVAGHGCQYEVHGSEEKLSIIRRLPPCPSSTLSAWTMTGKWEEASTQQGGGGKPGLRGGITAPSLIPSHYLATAEEGTQAEAATATSPARHSSDADAHATAAHAPNVEPAIPHPTSLLPLDIGQGKRGKILTEAGWASNRAVVTAKRCSIPQPEAVPSLIW